MTGSANAKWASLRLRALSRALDCHVKLDLPVARTYSVLALEYLKVYAECVDIPSFQPAPHNSDAQKDTVKKIVLSWNETPQDDNVTGESYLGSVSQNQ